MHELAHLFINFLNYGDPGANTPAHISSNIAGAFSNHEHGESGRRLECMLFGGNLTFHRDIGQGDGEVSQDTPARPDRRDAEMLSSCKQFRVPYIMKQDRQGGIVYYKVHQRAIDDLVSCSKQKPVMQIRAILKSRLD